jgi:Cu/Zn superoxide dismutase
MRSITAMGLAMTACLALAACMQGPQSKTVTVPMSAAEEVPPNTSAGKGTAALTLDPAAKKVTWKVTWENLTGDAAAAHIHGPAAPGANAGVVAPLGAAGPLKSPLEGSATLTDAQWADLIAGKDYINVHTAANKGGEIRGQIKP